MVINEMERDEQAAIINKLQQLLNVNNQNTVSRTIDNIPFTAQPEDIVNRNVFIVPRKTETGITNRINDPSRIIKRSYINKINYWNFIHLCFMDNKTDKYSQ